MYAHVLTLCSSVCQIDLNNIRVLKHHWNMPDPVPATLLRLYSEDEKSVYSQAFVVHITKSYMIESKLTLQIQS